MKISFKILVANLLISIVIASVSLLGQSGYNTGTQFALAFGLTCLGMSILNFLVGIILLIAGKKEWGSGMLISFAVLLLLSGISCSQSLQGL